MYPGRESTTTGPAHRTKVPLSWLCICTAVPTVKPRGTQRRTQPAPHLTAVRGSALTEQGKKPSCTL